MHTDRPHGTATTRQMSTPFLYPLPPPPSSTPSTPVHDLTGVHPLPEELEPQAVQPSGHGARDGSGGEGG